MRVQAAEQRLKEGGKAAQVAAGLITDARP
jgi:hypothetical protein